MNKNRIVVRLLCHLRLCCVVLHRVISSYVVLRYFVIIVTLLAYKYWQSVEGPTKNYINPCPIYNILKCYVT